MAKSDKLVHRARVDGMCYALKIAKENGIEELEKEVKFRNAHYVPLEITRDILLQCNRDLADRITQTLLTTVFMSLVDEFHFGKKRLEDFNKRFYKECEAVDLLDPYGEHFVTIRDMAEFLNEKYGCDFDLDIIAKIENENDQRRVRKEK